MPNHTVLTFVSNYLPAYKSGGPVQSVANIVDHLGDEFSFRIVTQDRDTGDTEPFPGVTVGEWCAVGKCLALYLNATDQSLRRISQIMQDTTHDMVYLNSFFHPRSTILPLLAQRLGLAPRRPTIVAVRGEFSNGALKLKSARKRAYIAAVKALNLYEHVLWQASSKHEAADIQAIFGSNARIHIASDLPRAISPELPHRPREEGHPLRVLFLSRISPMKNLEFALEVLAKVHVPVDFSIFGPISDLSYWERCQRAIDALPAHVSVRYQGIAPSSEVLRVMAEYDLLFLPTLGENFGHVIIEALGAGTPVLISDQTPWQDLAAAGCGWAEPLGSHDSFIAHIDNVYAQTGLVASARRQAARDYACSQFNTHEHVNDNRDLFRAAAYA